MKPFAYLDDIVIVLSTFFSLLIPISEFYRSQVRYLGFVVQWNLTVNSEKVPPILEYPAPRNLKQLHRIIQFLNMSFYHRFIPQFATISEPLMRNYWKRISVESGDEQHHLKRFACIWLQLRPHRAGILTVRSCYRPMSIPSDSVLFWCRISAMLEILSRLRVTRYRMPKRNIPSRNKNIWLS